MLKYVNYSIVFQEIPNEVTLAINISNCPNRCKGCHSPYLWDDIGEELNEAVITNLLEKYGNAITCICFMGGDIAPVKIEKLAIFINKKTNGTIKKGWYSGKDILPAKFSVQNFDYIKLGPYIERLGGLDSALTNQRFYSIRNGKMIDTTKIFQNRY